MPVTFHLFQQYTVSQHLKFQKRTVFLNTFRCINNAAVIVNLIKQYFFIAYCNIQRT